MIRIGGYFIRKHTRKTKKDFTGKRHRDRIKTNKRKTVAIPINGVVINVPYTTLLGIRYDEYYGDTFVYLLESKRKKSIQEFHIEASLVTDIGQINKRELIALKKQIDEYNSEMDEEDDGEGMWPAKVRKQTLKNKIIFETPIYG